MEQGFTIDGCYENTDIIKKSKFIAKCYNVNTKAQVDDIIKQLKQQYSDATHICYAYVLSGIEQKFNDDGEPQGTAGMPILNCIIKQNLQYVLVVVIRYFGGIKLGAGGLTRTYTNSASSVLKIANKRPLLKVEEYSLIIESNEVNKLERLRQYEAVYDMKFHFEENISVTLLLHASKSQEVEKIISSILNKNINLTFLNQKII